ncbi:hypothetical protein [Chitinasiproducens palmae]|uniref:Tail spike TSP1/Gp66 N-terminal domain-containing protein n=1 Tax=Chitinasiproducens palmae TaxID=1770053 RepID=A0A1H2PSP4_9BURK|nr:hypothetical protein [Chitinasiproducens palmae]SDV49182.1 hypothetical protein SAMN05216551_107134 [Chitinasiproducens palmae]
MTVESPTSQVGYTGNGSTRTFAVPFYFLRDTDLLVEVVKDDASTTLTLNSGYTVAGVGTASGGSITTTATYDSTNLIIVSRAVPLTQETVYQQNSAFPAKTQEKALDRLTMMVQQHQRAIQKSLRFPNADQSNASPILPFASKRAKKALVFGSDGSAGVSASPYVEAPDLLAQAATAAHADAAAMDALVLEVANRGIRIPESSVAYRTLLPLAAYRAGKVIKFTPGGDVSTSVEPYREPSELIDAMAAEVASATVLAGTGQIGSIAALRAYNGALSSLYIVDKLVTIKPGGRSGQFVIDDTDDGSIADDGAEFVRDALGRLWRRRFSGPRLARWWGVTGDGIACGANVLAALAACLKRGGAVAFPEGEVNWGISRFDWVYDGTTKALDIVSEGATLWTYDNIDPPARPDGTNWVSEPNLFSYQAAPDLTYGIAPQVRVLPGIRVSYARQRNQGGTDLDTLAVTHPTPHSVGVRAFFFRYVDRPVIDGVVATDIYGDFAQIRQCILPQVDNCYIYNVSAGNVLARNGAMDKDSNGGGIFFWGCYGIARKNFIWNPRVYLASVVSPENSQQMQGTICGYIGVWGEYALNVSSSTAPPPFNTVIQSTEGENNRLFVDDQSRGNVFEGNTIFGYVMLIKTEAKAIASVLNNVCLNGYLPIFVSGTNGLVAGNFVDMMGAGDVKSPQNGFEFIRAHIPGHTYTEDGAFNSGVLVSGNRIHIRGTYAPFSFDRYNMRYVGNTVIFRGNNAPAFINSQGVSKAVRGSQLDGNIFLYADSTFNVARTNIPSQLGFQMTRNVFMSFRVNTIGIQFPNESTLAKSPLIEGNQFYGDFYVNTLVPQTVYRANKWFRYSSNPGGFCLGIDAAATGSVSMDDEFNVCTTMTAEPIDASCEGLIVLRSKINWTDSGTATITACMKNMPASLRLGPTYEGVRITGNNQNLAMLRAGSILAPRFIDCRSDNSAYMYLSGGTVYGPMVVEQCYFAGGLVSGNFPEPNTSSRLAAGITPYSGMRLPPYLRPAAGGKEGEVYIDSTSGWKTYGSITA